MCNNHKVFPIDSGNSADKVIGYQTAENLFVFWLQDPSAQVPDVISMIRSQISQSSSQVTVFILI